MDKKWVENGETRKFKETILVEIFSAYRESATVHQKTTDPEIRLAVLDLKRCYDRLMHHLSPMGVEAEKLWEELGTRFSD
jgi:hypothetical protein